VGEVTADEILQISRVPRFSLRRRWRLALIGVGGIAQSAHLPAYRKGQQIGLPIEVVAAADVDERQRERARRLWGIPAVYADFREMLERERPDVVDITLHWERHADAKLAAVQTAAEYGCHILLQKPMAATWEQCVAMVEAAKKAGVLLAVNQNARFAPTFFAARRLVEAGAIGKPFALLLRSDFPNRYPAMVHDFCVHTMDLLRWLMGETPKIEAAMAQHDDRFRWCVTFLARYPSDAVATAIDTTCTPFATGWRFELHGTEGSLIGTERYDDAVTMEPSKLQWISEQGEVILRGTYRYVPDAFLWALCDLLEAAEQERTPLCSGDDNLQTMKLLFDAEKLLADATIEVE
jgi:predicted dehydrogenase